MDAAEFRRLGFLQEANRLFFHPHGLALSVRIIETDREPEEIGESDWMKDRLVDVLAAVAKSEVPTDYDHLVARRVCASIWPKGSVHLADVWDSDDPEGIVFGDDPEDKRRLAEIPFGRRYGLARARSRLFHGADGEIVAPRSLDEPEADVESLDYVYEEQKKEG